MTFITIMIVVLSTGDEVALGFSSQRECGEALLRMPDIAAEMGVEIGSASCYETVAPGTSPHPKPKPEVI